MKVYRFAVHPEEDGYFFLECINDPHLFTQARSMDERYIWWCDVVECMYEIKGVIVESVVPPDVSTAFERASSKDPHDQAAKEAADRCPQIANEGCRITASFAQLRSLIIRVEFLLKSAFLFDSVIRIGHTHALTFEMCPRPSQRHARKRSAVTSE